MRINAQFKLDSRLAKDTTWLGDFPLCRLLIHKEAMAPWFILVPRIDKLSELHHLENNEQVAFMQESSFVAKAIETEIKPDKINIAALGNIVNQLHIHHVPRFSDDFAWPHPIWGKTLNKQRTQKEQEKIAAFWQDYFSNNRLFNRQGLK
jgi:diadenosine tetraphosphate (Ap4A) HIT family hydrolase